MAGNRAGGILAAQKVKENHGKDFFVKIGALGGKAGNPSKKGFASMPREKVVEAGIKGGQTSRR